MKKNYTIKDCVNLYQETEEYKTIKRELDKKKMTVIVEGGKLQATNKADQRELDKIQEEVAKNFFEEYM